jgi:hypothetical protein
VVFQGRAELQIGKLFVIAALAPDVCDFEQGVTRPKASKLPFTTSNRNGPFRRLALSMPT